MGLWCQPAALNSPAVWGLGVVAEGGGRCWSGLENIAIGTDGRGISVVLPFDEVPLAGGVLVTSGAGADVVVRG